jgi:hypothetical protein
VNQKELILANGSSGSGNILGTLSTDQATSLNAIGAVLGGLASIDPDPYSSGVLTAASVAFKLAAIFSPDQTQTELNNLAQTVHDLFLQLGAVNAAAEQLSRKSNLDQMFSPLSTTVTDLPLCASDPVNYPPGDYISMCQAALTQFLFSDDLVWNITYMTAEFDNIYWNDSGQSQSACYYPQVGGGYALNAQDNGYGLQTPPLNSDNVTVFDYKITLPFYLWAITVFFAVGRLDPKFATNMSDAITKARNKLDSIYGKIMTPGSGLTPLSPPDWTQSSLLQTACPAPVGGGAPSPPPITLSYSAGPQPLQVSGAVIEYGAIEKYSGSSSVGNSYRIVIKTPADMQDPAIFNKLQIRVLKRMKDVYSFIGFPTVRQAINQLTAVLADGGPTEPNYLDWSLREVFNLAKLAPASSPQSMKALAAFLVRTQPPDTPYTQAFPNVTVSLRQLLTNVPN